MNNVSAKRDEITVSSGCSNFVTFEFERGKTIELRVEELIEFLARTTPLCSLRFDNHPQGQDVGGA